MHRPAILGGLIVLAVLVGYASSLSIGFELDDAYFVASNEAIRSLWNTPRFFWDASALAPTIPTSHDLRGPLMLTYALNYAISGLDPWSYHLLGLLIHLGVAGLVCLVARDILKLSPTMAAVTALLFALAPLNGQPIIYQSARSASLMTLCYLAAFYAYARDWPKRGALFQALALLTKAVALTLPVTLLLYILVYRRRSPRAALAFVLTLVIDGLYLLYRALLMPVLPMGPAGTSWQWFLAEIPTVTTYARRFVWPSDLAIDHQNVWMTPGDPRLWLAGAAIVATIGLAYQVRHRAPVIAFGIGWFFLTLVPESSIIPLGEVANDHRPYIASVGLALIGAWLLIASTRRRALVPICVTLAVLSVTYNWQRNYVWQDTVRLWQHTAMTNPGNPRAWMNAGVGLMARGQFAEARRHFDEARRLAPQYSYVYANLAILDNAEGKTRSATENASKALALGYTNPLP